MQEALEGAEAGFALVVQWLRLATEASAALWLAVGSAYALVALIAAHVRGQPPSYGAIWLRFSRYLSLALEFSSLPIFSRRPSRPRSRSS